MNRQDFQQLADIRVAEAQSLLTSGMWDGAYYLAGYAVECGLKACVAKLTKAEDYPPEKKIVEACYSHDLAKLLDLAGLGAVIKADAPTGSPLAINWDVVRLWTERSRYTRTPEVKARQLVTAVTDPAHGVLPWIKRYW